MKIKRIVVAAISLLLFSKGMAQDKDSVKTLKEIIVTGYKTVNGVGHLLESKMELFTPARKQK